MAQLTEEQVERAAIAGSRVAAELGYPQRLSISTPQEEKEMAHKVMRAAAPFLQMSWDEPTMDEANAIERNISRHAPPCDQLMRALTLFVNRRNASLLPKPVDPRAEALHEALVVVRRTNPMSTQQDFDEATADILRILDDKKIYLEEEEE